MGRVRYNALNEVFEKPLQKQSHHNSNRRHEEKQKFSKVATPPLRATITPIIQMLRAVKRVKITTVPDVQDNHFNIELLGDEGKPVKNTGN